ncbi:nitroreductase family protein [Planomonospora sp. ID67723]|uniref:Acg family FMN-binding oxidoreductase n=1 Tax=Planomonospora sp. ID67723 TaxID=2738134 RepID=UPI0018C40E70|nr:nitroreductase family protein [Planomonospora sp. ID67723]MBG0830102.1 nitroreductase family protein [Planomonospora sp. ID67723]
MLNPLATHAGARRLITAAGAAPSVHNTQPWRFIVRHREYVELHADPDRWLKVADPRGRSLRISCGAALLNLRLALRVSGHRPVTWSVPGAGDGSPTLLAAVRPASAAPASAAEHDLYGAIKTRRTNRQPFTGAPVPQTVMDELITTARIEGAALVPLRAPASAALLEEVATAEEALTGNRGYRTELARWTSGQSDSDGVPPYVQGPRPIGDLAPVRDFARVTRERVRFEAHPQLAVLTTPGDGPADWLRAGQALQRVLLVATLHGVSASFLNQPLDLRDMRRHTDPRHPGGHPQVIIRLGYGPAVPRAPRRPVPELLRAA